MTTLAIAVCFDELRRKIFKTAGAEDSGRRDSLACFNSLNHIATIIFDRT
jgi:hypothetical protein